MRLLRLLKNDLAKETTFWVAEDIISPDQAVQICSRYGIDYYNQGKQSYGYFILTILGFLFMGLALITIIGANWDVIPRMVRMVSLILLTLLVNLTGVYKVVKGERAVAIGIFFLGGLCYGASIMLIAQIYHIGEHYPDGIFWWSAGILPLALLMESTLLLLLAGTLGFIWFFVESYLGFYPALFPVLLVVFGWHCFKVKKSSLLFLILISGGCFWIEYSLSWLLADFHGFDVGVENVVVGSAVFIFLYAVAHGLAGIKNSTLEDYGILLGTWVLRFTLVSLLVFSFYRPWFRAITAQWSSPTLTLGVTLLFLLSAVRISYVYCRDKISFIVAVSSCYLFLLLLLVFSTGWGEGFSRDLGKDFAVILQVIDNIVLVLSGTWLIVRGIRHSITHYFFLGIITILFTALMRYVDLVGDYIGAAILFVLFAVILLSAARFWKLQHRKKEGNL